MTRKFVKILRGCVLVMALMFLGQFQTQAQCPMCRISLESNLKQGGTAGKGMNAGIFLLLFTPYIMVGGLAYVWHRNRRKNA